MFTEPETAPAPQGDSLLNAVARSLGIHLLVIDDAGIIQDCNDTFFDLVGAASDTVLGQSIDRFIDQVPKPTNAGGRREARCTLHTFDERLNVEVAAQRLIDTCSPTSQILVTVRVDTETQSVESIVATIFEATRESVGLEALDDSVKALADIFNVRWAFIGEPHGPQDSQIKILSLWNGDAPGTPFTYELAGTPCELVPNSDFILVEHKVAEDFPEVSPTTSRAPS